MYSSICKELIITLAISNQQLGNVQDMMTGMQRHGVPGGHANPADGAGRRHQGPFHRLGCKLYLDVPRRGWQEYLRANLLLCNNDYRDLLDRWVCPTGLISTVSCVLRLEIGRQNQQSRGKNAVGFHDRFWMSAERCHVWDSESVSICLLNISANLFLDLSKFPKDSVHI